MCARANMQQQTRPHAALELSQEHHTTQHGECVPYQRYVWAKVHDANDIESRKQEP
jgi:hypothetical protein